MEDAPGEEHSDPQQQNQSHFHHYEDNQDSDVESRLYAEIYYAKNIIGDIDDQKQAVVEKNVTTDNSSTAQAGNQSVLNESSNGSKTHENLSGAAAKCGKNNSIDNTCNASNAQLRDDSNRESGSSNSTQNTSSSGTLGSITTKKRFNQQFNQNSLEENRSGTKRRRLHENDKHSNKDTLNQQGQAQNTLTSRETSRNRQAHDNTVHYQRNANINPYNSSNQVKLFSPTFYQLLFGKKSRIVETINKCGKPKNIKKSSNTRNKHNYESQKSRPLQRNNTPKKINCNHIFFKDFPNEINTNSAVIDKQDERVKNNSDAQNNSNDTSVIIDISSDSSEEVTELASKYDSIETTEKKFEKKLACNNISSVSSESESEESIFEVPVPPKPTPLLIDLKDSDNENNDKNDISDDDSFLNESTISVQTSTSIRPDSLNKSHITSESESDKQDSLILNCSVVQKGASDLQEIRTMSNDAQPSTSKAACNEDSEITGQNQNSSQTPQNLDTPQIYNQSKQNEPRTPITSSTSKTASPSIVSPNKQSNLPENYYFQPMSKTMKAFYDESWGGENFDMEKLRSNMSSDSRKWAILNEDLYGSSPLRNRRYFGIVCNRCHKNGHKSPQCPEPYKNPICHMCGVTGHFESSCPHKKCLTCGNKQRMYTKICEICIKMYCSRCKSRGHSENSCPDLWRRYHHTVKINNVESSKNSKQVMKPQHELFCCNCAQKGHDYDKCKKLRWSQHFPTPSSVVNYNGPAYTLDNFHDSRITNNQVTHQSSSSSNFASNNSINSLNTRNEISTISNRGPNVNSIDSYQSNVIGAGKSTVIFEIKPNSFKANRHTSSFHLDLKSSNEIYVDTLNDWKYLTRFFSTLVSEIPVHFWLEQDNKHLRVGLRCSQNVIGNLIKLIRQYASRNNAERSCMFLGWMRDPQKMCDFHSRRILEMNSLKEDLLKLYDLYTKLHSDSIITKILAILYREDFADDSLKKLNRIYTRINKRVKKQLSNMLKKKKKSNNPNASKVLIKVKIIIEYIYLYNNVFVPYRPTNLSEYIERYKQHVKNRDDVTANSTISPLMQKQNNTTVQVELNSEKSKQNQIYDLRALPVNSSPCVNAPTKLNNNSLMEPSQPNNSSSQKNAVPSFTNAKKPDVSAPEQLKSSEKTQFGEKPLKNLIKKFRYSLNRAKKLKLPDLRKHIGAMEKKLKDGTYTDVVEDYKKFRRLVRRAIKQRGIEQLSQV